MTRKNYIQGLSWENILYRKVFISSEKFYYVCYYLWLLFLTIAIDNKKKEFFFLARKYVYIYLTLNILIISSNKNNCIDLNKITMGFKKYEKLKRKIDEMLTFL